MSKILFLFICSASTQHTFVTTYINVGIEMISIFFLVRGNSHTGNLKYFCQWKKANTSTRLVKSLKSCGWVSYQ